MELDLRGTDADTLRRYLATLGGTVQRPDLVTGPGWSASLTESIHRFAKWELPRVVIRFEGDPETLSELVRRFRVMAWRGGG